MSILVWALIVIAVVAIVVGLYALIRNRQRSGDVLASRPVSNGGRS